MRHLWSTDCYEHFVWFYLRLPIALYCWCFLLLCMPCILLCTTVLFLMFTCNFVTLTSVSPPGRLKLLRNQNCEEFILREIDFLWDMNQVFKVALPFCACPLVTSIIICNFSKSSRSTSSQPILTLWACRSSILYSRQSIKLVNCTLEKDFCAITEMEGNKNH